MKFTLQQFAKSAVAKQHNIDNTIPEKQKANIQEFINNLLNPLANAYGKDIIISSGYRCPQLNKVFGNDPNASSHSEGYGVDLVPANGAIDEFKDFVAKWIRNKNFDQYIDEQNSSNKWVHITYKNSDGKQRKQGLKTQNNKCGKIDLTQHSATAASNPQSTIVTTQSQTTATGVSNEMFNKIAVYESGKKFGYSMVAKDLNGYDLGDAKGHKTYGYGLLFHPNGKYMDTIKSSYTQGELEQLFIQTTQNKVNTVKSWASKNNITLNQNQIDALVCAIYNFGTGFLTKTDKVYSATVNLIKNNPNNQTIKNSWYHISDAQGKKYPGLITRRKGEADWYFGSGATASSVTYGGNGSSSFSSDSGVSEGSSNNTNAGSYSTGGSIGGSVDTRQYNDINVMSIRTGGSTQTGSTEGLLTGKSIYLKTEISEDEVKNNGVYLKDENGEIVKDENGNPVPTDEYVYNEVEVENEIENLEDLPDITTPEQKKEQVDDGTKKIGSAVDKESIKKEANLSEDQKKKVKKEKIKKSKKKWKNKFKDLDKEEVKAELMDWLSNQSIMIQNAFHILIIKDTIDQIKTFLQQLKNTSIENQMDLLNSINDILSVFEMLGLTPDAKGITMQDLKELGLAVAGTAIETAKNIGDQIQQNAYEYTQNQINAANTELAALGDEVLSNDIISDAKMTVAGITDKVNNFQGLAEDTNSMINDIGDTASNIIENSTNGAFNLEDNANAKDVVTNTAKSVGIDIAESLTNQLTSNIVDTGLNLDLDAITNGDIPVINSDGFVYTQTTNEKNINIDITITKNPSFHLLSITSFIKSFKDGKNKNIFNNGATKEIKDGFKESWELNDIVELKIQAIVNGITKFYIFTFNVDQASRKKEETGENNSNINQKETNNLFSKLEDQVNSVENKFNNLESDITNTASEIKDNVVNTATNIGEQIQDKAIDTINNAQDKVIDAGNKAISQLTKVNININADKIEQVLAGKVLMFDEVVQFLKILQPIIETLKFIAHLLENYMINKEFVKTKQHAELSKALKNAAQLINGLKDIVNLKDTNFFTIRTKEMSEWAIDTYKRMPNEEGYLTIGQIDSATDALLMTTGNNADTVTLNTYCAMHGINPDCPLDLLKGTTLYFDKWGIDHGGYQDGTSNGLDNIEINRLLGEIYYDKLNRSTISSEILRARKKNIDPFENIENAENHNISNYTNTNDEIDYKSILDTISFKSDEFEGPQTLNIGDLNLCSPTIKNRNNQTSQQNENNNQYQGSHLNGNGIIENNENIGETHSVIIEFGDEYTLGNRVDGHFTVKPGQTINEGDYIGFIRKDGNDVSIKTEYTGIVRSIDENNTDYYRVYPSFTTKQRHIIIDNPTKCSATTYDIKDVMNLQKTFKKATELEALITNCMPLSILPSILKNATRNSSISESYNIFNQTIKTYDSYVNDCANKMKHQAEELKKSANINSINNMKDDMFKSKQDLITYAISSYMELIDENYKVAGDNRYLDCAGLVYNSTKDFKRYGDDDTLEYGNYYLNLLKSIPQTTKMSMPTIDLKASNITEKIDKLLDQSFGEFGKQLAQTLSNTVDNMGKINQDDNEQSKIDEFRNIIKNIIDIRLAYEERNVNNMINIFNNYCYSYTYIQNYYTFLQNEIKDGKINIEDSQSILSRIKKDMRYTDGDDSELFDVCQQALTLFMYISNADITKDDNKTKNLYGTQKAYNKQTINETIINVSESYINSEKPVEYSSTTLNNTLTYTNFNDLYEIVYNDTLYMAQHTILPSTQVLMSDVEQNIINKLSNLLNAEPEIIKHLINARNGEDLLQTESKIFFTDIAENNMYYKMIQDEATKLEEFWLSVIDEYKNCNTSKAIEDLSTYANNLNTNAIWPQKLNIQINNSNYDLYTFIDPYKTKNEIPEVDIPFKEYEINDNKLQVNTPDVSINLEDNKDIRENSEITIFDYEYWAVYMLNATLFTLNPMFWADGFDLPPFMTPMLLPAIYVPIAPPVLIPNVNVLMVFGIALRGIWPAPIILMINLSSDDIDVLIFIKMAMELIKDMFIKMQETVENTIPNIANKMLQNYLDENEIAEKAIEKFRTYASIIKAIPIKDKALLEREFNEALEDELNKPNKLTEAQSKLDNASREIEEEKTNAMNSINQGFSDMNQRANAYTQEGIEEQEVYFNGTTKEKIAYYQAKKKKREKKKYDRRQVVTREADLGSGTPPM